MLLKKWFENTCILKKWFENTYILKNGLKILALRMNVALFETQNCYAKDRFWDSRKSIVREISLTVHARVANVERGSRSP